jgi:plasmid maintenance system killer protein
MTGWDILDKFIGSFPPIVMALILMAVLTAVVIFIIGFSKHGVNFIKYGFKQTVLDSSLEKRFDSLEAKFDERFSQIDARFSQIDARFMAIETNHFGHLKNFLSELTSILLDKNIINNTEKARLDNQLRDM